MSHASDLALIARGAEEILKREELEARLATIPAHSKRKVFMLGEVTKPAFSRHAPLSEAA